MLPVPTLHRWAVGGSLARRNPMKMDAPTPSARRRLRRRPSPAAVPESEVIELDSSSDDFDPSAGSAGSDSDVDAVKTTKSSRKNDSVTTSTALKRGFKRLRRPSSDSDSNGDASSGAMDADQQEAEWECVRCTYLNEPRRLACELCLTVRVAPRATRKLSAWLTAAPLVDAKPKTKKPAKASATNGSAPLAVETIDSSDDELSQTRHGSKPKLQGDELLWVDSASTDHVDELCVQKKKVQEVQEWLQQSVPLQGSHSHMGTKRLLFLCGPPGSGKSTTVRHLAKVMGLSIKEWMDNSSVGKLQFHRHLRDEFQLFQQSSWDDFIDFINRSVNYSALQIAAVPDKRSRKRPLSQPPQTNLSLAGCNLGQVILIENWPLNPFGTGQDSTIWDEKLKMAFRQVVSPAANLQYPVVCIFSDVRDKKIDTGQLVKLFSDEVVRSPSTTVINFNPVTTVQMKKTLNKAAEKYDWKISAADLAKVIETSNGDIRHAFNMIQLIQRRLSRSQPRPQHVMARKRGVKDSNHVQAEEESGRDPFFSDFHIVGKLLHSKNIMTDGSSRLMEFDRVLDSSAMSLDRILSLLHSNCIDYFTEVDDLDQALELMSNSEMWLYESYRATSSSQAFKTSHDLVRSLLVRSVALTNQHPAPSAFRPIAATRTHETSRRMVSGRQDALLQQQQWTDNSSFPYLCRGDLYSFEIQPFVDVMKFHQQSALSSSQHPGNRTWHGIDLSRVATDVVEDDIQNSDGDDW